MSGAPPGPGSDDATAVAARLGVELDAAEAHTWMLAVAASDRASLGADAVTGVFGDRVALLDFDPEDLDRLRRLVPHIRLVAHCALTSAIAISGSSAQGRVQLFPGDADFFERAHIRASTEDEAQQVLRTVMRETALRALLEPDIVLVEVNLGAYDEPVVERRRAGPPVTPSPGRPTTWSQARSPSCSRAVARARSRGTASRSARDGCTWAGSWPTASTAASPSRA